MEVFRVMANGNHGWPEAEGRIFQIQLHIRPEASARLEVAILMLVSVRVREVGSEQELGAGLVYISEDVSLLPRLRGKRLEPTLHRAAMS
jgi:hypothetical protein